MVCRGASGCVMHACVMCRSNAVTITLFVAPQALLMQVPLIGPLVYVPMQFASAWLLNMLLTDVPTRPPVAATAPGSQVTMTAFTYHIQLNYGFRSESSTGLYQYLGDLCPCQAICYFCCCPCIGEPTMPLLSLSVLGWDKHHAHTHTPTEQVESLEAARTNVLSMHSDFLWS